jgi:hypothetical protein
MLYLAIGRAAGRAEMFGLLGTSYSRNSIGDYNEALKPLCNESRYNGLKIRYPDARPKTPDDLVDEYGDYCGPGAAYESEAIFHNETIVRYLVIGRTVGMAEAFDAALKEDRYKNETEKLDKVMLAETIINSNAAIQEYNTLLKAHCDESRFQCAELMAKELPRPPIFVPGTEQIWQA